MRKIITLLSLMAALLVATPSFAQKAKGNQDVQSTGYEHCMHLHLLEHPRTARRRI